MSQPIDVDQLMSRCMGQLDFAQEILRDFLETCETGLIKIRELGTDSDIESLRSTAHRLKGTSATVAAIQLSRIFEDVERFAASGDFESAIDRIGQLDEEFCSVKKFVVSMCQPDA